MQPSSLIRNLFVLRAEANAENLKGQRITELLSPELVILSSSVPKAQSQSQKREEKDHKKENNEDRCMDGGEAHETSFLAEGLLAVDWCLGRKKNTISSDVWALIGCPGSRG